MSLTLEYLYTMVDVYIIGNSFRTAINTHVWMWCGIGGYCCIGHLLDSKYTKKLESFRSSFNAYLYIFIIIILLLLLLL